jgi:hypothetical protein
MWKSGRAHRGRDVEVRPGNPNSGWSAVDVTSQAGFLAGRPSSPGKRAGRGRRFLDDPMIPPSGSGFLVLAEINSLEWPTIRSDVRMPIGPPRR